MNLWKKIKLIQSETKTQLWKAFQPCEETGEIVNSNFSIAFKKYCCNKKTQFPSKLMMCEDVETDLLGVVLPNAVMDGIFTGHSINKIPPRVSEIKVHDDARIYDHVPISCTVNGIRVISWNMSGMCNEKYFKAQYDSRWASAIDFLKENKFDVLCIQNLYARNRVESESYMKSRVNRLLGIKDSYYTYYQKEDSNEFTILYDKYTDVVVVRTKLIDKTKPEHRVSRYLDDFKKISMVYINAESPFYLVNVHLKTPKKSQHAHDMEVASLLDYMNTKSMFETGVVLIGSFNQNHPETILAKTRRVSKYGRRGQTR